MTIRQVSMRAASVILALPILAACGAPPPGPGTGPEQSAPLRLPGYADVAVKGAFDPDDGEAVAPAPLTEPRRSQRGKKYSPYAGRSYPTRVVLRRYAQSHRQFRRRVHGRQPPDPGAGLSLRARRRGDLLHGRSGQAVAPAGLPGRLRPRRGPGRDVSVLRRQSGLVSGPDAGSLEQGIKAGGQEAGDATQRVISAQAQDTLPPPIKDPKIVGPIMKSVWQQYTATAEKFNEPGRFTAMIGYEWTSVPGGNNLHRNVLFRDGKDKADQVLPFSSWQSEDPEKLWDWMAQVRREDRRQAARHCAQRATSPTGECSSWLISPASRCRRTTPSGARAGRYCRK